MKLPFNFILQLYYIYFGVVIYMCPVNLTELNMRQFTTSVGNKVSFYTDTDGESV